MVAHESLVSAQGPLVLGFWVLGLRVWGQGLTIGPKKPLKTLSQGLVLTLRSVLALSLTKFAQKGKFKKQRKHAFN